MKRIEEWIELGHIVPYPVGCKWNLPLLGIKKISSGIVNSNDLKICLNFRVVIERVTEDE